MSKFLIRGGKKLEGEVSLSGNKNSVLKLLPAVLIADTPSTISNLPDISDVSVMLDLISSLGAKVERKADVVRIDPSGLNSFDPNPSLCAQIRASVVLAAPLLVRFGKTVVTPPGGDQIGDRLLDTHFTMMEKLGVSIKRQDGRFYLNWDKRPKRNIKIFLEEASVTATEMGLIMAASLKDVDVEISDTASEPHIKDLGEMLIKMGADIKGLGGNILRIRGSRLKGTEHKVMPDHIEGGTFAIASAITSGHILINDFRPEDYRMALIYLESMGVKFKVHDNKLEVMPSNLVSTRRKFQTRPWPGFPTDLMSPFIVLATQTKGTVLCHDWMYEWRMFFVDDLISMGANIFIADPHRVIISGPTKLMADRLFCKDIRAGISVIIAAMAANGESIIENIETVKRGYMNIGQRFANLGASIKEIE